MFERAAEVLCSCREPLAKGLGIFDSGTARGHRPDYPGTQLTAPRDWWPPLVVRYWHLPRYASQTEEVAPGQQAIGVLPDSSHVRELFDEEKSQLCVLKISLGGLVSEPFYEWPWDQAAKWMTCLTVGLTICCHWTHWRDILDVNFTIGFLKCFSLYSPAYESCLVVWRRSSRFSNCDYFEADHSRPTEITDITEKEQLYRYFVWWWSLLFSMDRRVSFLDVNTPSHWCRRSTTCSS